MRDGGTKRMDKRVRSDGANADITTKERHDLFPFPIPNE